MPGAVGQQLPSVAVAVHQRRVHRRALRRERRRRGEPAATADLHHVGAGVLDRRPLEVEGVLDVGRVVLRVEQRRLVRPGPLEAPLRAAGPLGLEAGRVGGPDPPEVLVVVERLGRRVAGAVDRAHLVDDGGRRELEVGADLDLVALGALDRLPVEHHVGERLVGVVRRRGRRDRRSGVQAHDLVGAGRRQRAGATGPRGEDAVPEHAADPPHVGARGLERDDVRRALDALGRGLVDEVRVGAVLHVVGVRTRHRLPGQRHGLVRLRQLFSVGGSDQRGGAHGGAREERGRPGLAAAGGSHPPVQLGLRWAAGPWARTGAAPS